MSSRTACSTGYDMQVNVLKRIMSPTPLACLVDLRYDVCHCSHQSVFVLSFKSNFTNSGNTCFLIKVNYLTKSYRSFPFLLQTFFILPLCLPVVTILPGRCSSREAARSGGKPRQRSHIASYLRKRSVNERLDLFLIRSFTA